MDVYRIGVKIAATNGVSSVLRVIQKDLFGLNKTIDLTTGKFTGLKMAVVGAMGAMAGIGIGMAFKGLADAGGEVLNAQAKMLQVGISMRDVARETAVAYQNIGVSGATVAGNLNNLITLRAILGTLPAANASLPAYTQAQFALSSRGIDPGQLDQFVKALDIMGAFNTNGKIDPSKFGPALQMAMSAVMTTNGLLTGQGFYQAVRLSGPAAAAMGEQAYLKNMVEILLALGNRGARGLEYGATTFLGGQMSKNSAMMLDRLGLTKSSDFTHEGGRWSLDQGKIAGANLLAAGNIVGWIQQYFLPDAKRAGLSALQASATLPQTMQLLISTIANLTPQMARSVEQQAQAGTVNPYGQGGKSYAGTVSNLTTAITGLWQALGTPAAQMAIPILNGLAGSVRSITQWLGDHQAVAKAIDATLLGLGVALTVLGSAAVLVAIGSMVGPAGAFAAISAGIIGLATALTVLKSDLPTLPAWLRAPKGTYNANGQLAVPIKGGLGIEHLGAEILNFLNGKDTHTVYYPNGTESTSWNTSSNTPIQLTGTINIDGKKVGSVLASGMSAPSTGTSGVNLRSTPSGGASLQMPGHN